MTHLAFTDGERKVVIPDTLKATTPRVRWLYALVMSCPDSFAFVREDEGVRFVPLGREVTPDTPWHDEVGYIIERHFQFELAAYMPGAQAKLHWYPD